MRTLIVIIGSIVWVAGVLTGDNGLLTVSGSVRSADDDQVPDRAHVAVVWNSGPVDSGSLISFGRAATTRDAFELNIRTDLPAHAINTDGVGVGHILLLESGWAPADGEALTAQQLDNHLLGASRDYVLIYRSSEGENVPSWAEDFAIGYSCALRLDELYGTRIVESPRFVPVDCSNITVLVDDSLDVQQVLAAQSL